MWHLIVAILKLVPKIIVAYFGWILSYFKKMDKIDINTRYQKVRRLICHANKDLKIDIHYEGLENIPDVTSCYVANHLSVVDPLLYFPLFEKPVSFLGKVEIEKYPVVGKLLTIGGGLFLKRDDLKQQLKVMMKVQDSLKEGDRNWFIFPEGTRLKDQMQVIPNFHQGTFRAPMKAGVPIVPVVNYGSFRILNLKHSLKKYPTYIKFLEPLYPSDYEGKSTEEVAVIVRDRIEKALTYEARAYDHKAMLELEDKHYRFNKVY